MEKGTQRWNMRKPEQFGPDARYTFYGRFYGGSVVSTNGKFRERAARVTE